MTGSLNEGFHIHSEEIANRIVRPLSAVFLDRDGTVNVPAAEGEYVTAPSQLQLLPRAGNAVARLNRAGVPVAIVTNQRGIALGRMTEADLVAVHARLAELLQAADAHVDLVLHCPHEVGTCSCRKPAPGLLYEAARRFGVVDLTTTAMVGDTESDIAAGQAAGSATVRLGPDGAVTAAGVRCPTLSDAVDRLLVSG